MVVVQRVVEPGDHPRGVAERRVHSDVLDPLAVDPDFTPVIEAVEKFLAGIGQQRFAARCRVGHFLPPLIPHHCAGAGATPFESTCGARYQSVE
jgi:hypothetical protein